MAGTARYCQFSMEFVLRHANETKRRGSSGSAGGVLLGGQLDEESAVAKVQPTGPSAVLLAGAGPWY